MSPASSPVHFGSFDLDLQSGELRKDGLKVRLGEQPFHVLVMLLEHPGQVVTRDELQRRLWSSDTFVDFEQSLNAAVKRLREALCDAAENPRYIETIPRHGYRLMAAVGGGETRTVREPSVFSEKSRRIFWSLTALFVIVAALMAIYHLLKDVKSAPVPIHSIAVMPFENLSSDPGQEYFSDGMTELLITELGKVRSLRVISRRSVMRFKGTTRTISEIGNELKVDALIEGAVLREGNTVRVSAQLIRIRPEEHLWAQVYERDLTKALGLQRELVLAVVSELRIRLTATEQSRIVSSYTPSYLAQDAYFLGASELEKFTPAAEQTAILAFERSIALDPGYALPHYGLADAYKNLTMAAPVSPRQAFPKAEAEALKALQLDPNLANAHTVVAWVKAAYYHDWATAESEFKRAIEINPSAVEAHRRYGWFLAWLGRGGEALAEVQYAIQLEPYNVSCYRSSGMVFYCQRNYAAAIKEWTMALKLDPNMALVNADLGRAYAEIGRYDEAIAQFKKARELFGGETGATATGGGWLGYAYARAGRREDAYGVLANLLSLSKRGYVSPLNIAMIYAGLGDKEHALDWLQRGYEIRDGDMVLLRVFPQWDSLRSEPRLENIVRHMNFPP